jgi:hemerythrin-like domain-containing protein
MIATQQLRSEHEGIALMLKILSELCRRMSIGRNVNVEHIEKVLELFKVFVDQCHHGKEEEMLFPALERVGILNEGGPIGQMLLEHEQGRQAVREMAEALSLYRAGEPGAAKKFCEPAHRYRDLLAQHIEKENQVLFLLAESRLSRPRQQDLADAFQALEKERIGEGKHEEFHEILEVLAAIYIR